MAKARSGQKPEKLTRERFEKELLKLQRELVIMQEYVRAKGLKIVVIFEGRDAAGRGGVMGFCTEGEYEEFMRSCPEFEHMLTRSGIKLIKYWFSISDEEQERRFQARVHDPMRRWKLSPMDLESRARWVAYSRAKDEMFRYTDIKVAPWWVVNADDKRRARLNCIAHLLSQIDYEDLTPVPIELPPRVEEAYVRPPIEEQTFVPELY
jgi:polyphosphate kinase